MTDPIVLGGIRRALSVLCNPGDVAELRVLVHSKRTDSGYFNDFDKLAERAAQFDGAPLYVTLNPVVPALLARAANRVEPWAKVSTGDQDILSRRRFLIDFDPKRPSGISATDQEHAAALARCEECRAWLLALGVPEGALVAADSGNGGHLLGQIDLPNDEENRILLERFLAAVAFEFNDNVVEVDVKTANAARITKLYGTIACKGDNVPDRPHRRSRLAEGAVFTATVSCAVIEQIAACGPQLPKETVRRRGGLDGFDGRQWVQGHASSLSIVREGAWNGDGYRWILNPCPWDPGHTNDAAYIVQMQSGAMAAGCHHNGCAGKDWHALRDLVEPEWQERQKDDFPQETVEDEPVGASPQDEEPTDGAKALDGLEQFLKRYVVFANVHQAVAVTLWTAHTHMIETAMVTPYLQIISPEKRCGKTLVLDLLALTCARPWLTIRPSEAVLFRKIHQHNATMLLDETDTIFRDKSDTYEGIRAVINAGYRRGATVSRCVVEEGRVRLAEFRVFCPKALAGIGALPDTVDDRSIPIRLVRKAKHERVERFRIKRGRWWAKPLVHTLHSWAARNVNALGKALEEDQIEIPDELNDRAQDGWEVLLGIADLAGGEWPRRARVAAVVLHADNGVIPETDGVTLLRGIRAVFQETGADEMFTLDLARALMKLDAEPWAEAWGKIQESSQALGHRLRKLLKPYGISSAKIRIGEQTGMGYQRQQFDDAFSRYLVPLDPPPSLIQNPHRNI
jgi:hypothetical protein